MQYISLFLFVSLPTLYGQEPSEPVNLSADVLAKKEDKVVFGKPICN